MQFTQQVVTQHVHMGISVFVDRKGFSSASPDAARTVVPVTTP
jgi:hypothetical protein